MEKTIFILRESVWLWDDKPCPSYVGVNRIYKRFATYEQALAEKTKLEIAKVRNHIFIDKMECNTIFYHQNYYAAMIKKDVFDYFKTNFGIDWKGFSESEFVDKSKLNDNEFESLANDFIRKKVLEDDKHILFVLEMLELSFYKISEVKEDGFLYKIYTNSHFRDFDFSLANNLATNYKEFVVSKDAGGETWVSYASFVEAEKALCIAFYDLIKSEKKSLKGSFSDLSENPEMLKKYLENYSKYFNYNAENKQLTFNIIEDEEIIHEVLGEFLALLRPEKIPFIIKSVPIAKMSESYIEKEEMEEKKRILEKSRQDRMKRFRDNNNFLS